MSDSRTERTRPGQVTRATADPIESMHDILSCWERRAVLYYLDAWDDPATVEDLAAAVAGWRRGDRAPATDPELVTRVRRGLVCDHVSRMDRYGVVDHESRTGVVRLADDMTVAVGPPWHDPGNSTLADS